MVTDLTKGSPAKVIFLYSLPIILSNVFQQVYSMVDSVIVGRFVNYQALAGLGVVNGLTFFILGFVMGITSGLGIRTAQMFGAGDMKGVRRSIGTSLIICTGLAIVLTALSSALVGPTLKLMNTPDDVYPYAISYVSIIFAGLATQVAYNMISCILRALGDSSTPLYFLIFSSLLNLGLDYLFIAVFGLGVRGAGIATIISQGLSAALCFGFAFWRYPQIRLSREDFRTSLSFIWEHLSIGLPMALQFSITAFGIILLQSALNSFPASYIAGFTAANKVQNVGFLVATAFGVAIANYSGQNYGAGDIRRVRRGVNVTLAMTLCVCAVASAMLALFADQMTELFLSPEEADAAKEGILDASRRYLHISAVFFPFLYSLFVFRNALQGIGKTFWPLMGGVLELIIRGVGAFTLPSWLGYRGIIFTDPMAWVGACTLLVIAYYLQMPKENPKKIATFEN